jgi:hypothetical protein
MLIQYHHRSNGDGTPLSTPTHSTFESRMSPSNPIPRPTRRLGRLATTRHIDSRHNLGSASSPARDWGQSGVSSNRRGEVGSNLVARRSSRRERRTEIVRRPIIEWGYQATVHEVARHQGDGGTGRMDEVDRESLSSVLQHPEPFLHTPRVHATTPRCPQSTPDDGTHIYGIERIQARVFL